VQVTITLKLTVGVEDEYFDAEWRYKFPHHWSVREGVDGKGARRLGEEKEAREIGP
jgi:hypothetical protein